MKQILIKKGGPVAVEVAEPAAMPGFLLVRLQASCISPGTEMAGIAASGRSLAQRVMAQPDKARAALTEVRRIGLAAVWRKARQTLEKEQLCGYSAAGTVIDSGPEVEGFPLGTRVAVAGAGMANHAEVVAVPVNLAVPIPENVDFEVASTVALGGIAMQAVRRARVSLGERVAVIGCGPLGLLAVQMLRASGCRVFATDLDARRLAMARDFGAAQAISPADEDVVSRATHWSGGMGVDAAIVFTATSSGEPVSQAFRMCRRKGRVVLAGVAGSEYKREDMYAKELDFLISTSYGPGRYDEDYELRGRDYPYAYVRWTEKRNMEAYLELAGCGQVKVAPMIEARAPIERAEEAYDKLKSPERPLLAVLRYDPDGPPEGGPRPASAPVGGWKPPAGGEPVNLALIGAGSFVQAMHLPHLRAMDGRWKIGWSCSRTGTGARTAAAGLDGCRTTTDYDEVLADTAVHAVLIGTRHDTHADLAIRALRAGKAVFVEKPMCLTAEEYEALRTAVEDSEAPFMVGYNRRFSPFAENLRKMTHDRVHPLMMHYVMNAGYLPGTHWTQGPEGGGRLLGEACHIIDLFRSLVGQPVGGVSCTPLRGTNPAALPTDNFSLTIDYQDGSVATLIYTALGHRDLPKERMEMFFDEKALVLDDYRALTCHGVKGHDLALQVQDKGHAKELDAFHRAVASGDRFPIPWEELLETWTVSHLADRICRGGSPLPIDS